MGFLLDSNCFDISRCEKEMIFLFDIKSFERLIWEQWNVFLLDSNNDEISERNGFLTWQQLCWWIQWRPSAPRWISWTGWLCDHTFTFAQRIIFQNFALFTIWVFHWLLSKRKLVEFMITTFSLHCDDLSEIIAAMIIIIIALLYVGSL